MLWSNSEQFRESSMEMERAEVHLLSDLTQRRASVEFRFHELDRRHKPSELVVGLEVGRTERAPIGDRRLLTDEYVRPFSKRRILSMRHHSENPQISVGIRQ